MSNPHIHEWAQEIWSKAEEAPEFLKINFQNKKNAEACRFALYTVRNQSRKDSKEIYQEGELEYGRSPWDVFKVTIKQTTNGYALFITKHSKPEFGNLEIEVG